MKVDLQGLSAFVSAGSGTVAATLSAALQAHGAAVVAQPAFTGPDTASDIGVFVVDLRPCGAAFPADPLALALEAGTAMAERGGGRLVFVFGAWGVLPMRRHPVDSARDSSLATAIRVAAMQLAPSVLVNGIAAGAIAGEDGALLAGDAAMPGHAALRRPGRVDDIASTLLFLCDPANTYMTGQIVVVDGGWSTGYARDF